MSYRPGWYQNENRSGGLGGWLGSLSGVGLVATVTGAAYLLQMMVFLSTKQDVLGQWLGLRAWWPGPSMGPSYERVVDLDAMSFNWLFPIQSFTYMLVHSVGDIMHLGWNLIFVFIFGREIEASLGRNGFLRLYVVSGVVGGLACWVGAMLDPSWIPTVGASGAMYGVMILYTLRWPRRTFLLIFPPVPVPIWLLTSLRVLGDLTGLFSGAGGVAFLAHLGGAAVGLLWFKRGDVVIQAEMSRRRAVAEKQSKQTADSRREMDRILAKIQAHGLGSLSSKERDFLDRRSKELREGGR